jgi:hypothetical protein
MLPKYGNARTGMKVLVRIGMVVAVTAASVSTTAAAPSPKLTNFARLMAEGVVGENAAEVHGDLAGGISLGPLSIALQQTPLAQVQGLFGGTVHSKTLWAGPMSWLCYSRPKIRGTRGPLTIWLISIADYPEAPKITMVVAQRVEAGKRDGCQSGSQGSKGLPSLKVPVPSIGSRSQALGTRFGVIRYDKVRNVYYEAARPLHDGSGRAVYQRLGYVISKGDVVGIGVGQSTN